MVYANAAKVLFRVVAMYNRGGLLRRKRTLVEQIPMVMVQHNGERKEGRKGLMPKAA